MSSLEPARRPVDESETQQANRSDWDLTADEYQAEHGAFLGDARFIWSPEGLDEADIGLLGEVAGKDILEVGCGAAQCSRWLRSRGARAVGFDLSHRQLQHAQRIDGDLGTSVPVAQATATALPFPDRSFDVACSAFGALPFVADAGAALREVSRVLRDGGRFVFSVTHPFRWCLPDDPGPAGLRVVGSYFDRTPYVEQRADGSAGYVEHHRTLGDWVRAVVAAGLVLEDVMEPEWPADHDRTWGGWGRDRGLLVPGTAVLVTVRPR